MPSSQTLAEIGNVVSNAYYEAKLPSNFKRPTPAADRK